MTLHSTFFEAIAQAQFANRCPSHMDYAYGSPAERRAILARWKEIAAQQPTMNNASDVVCARAFVAQIETGAPPTPQKPIYRPSVSRLGDHEEYAGEAADRDVDDRGFNLTEPT